MNDTVVFKNTGTEIGKLASLILLTVVVLAAAFFLTQAYHRTEDAASRYWYGKGQEAYGAGDFAGAVADFRTALSSSHDEPRYQLNLARALAKLGKFGEAESYLTLLLHDHPGDSVVNLELARIAVSRHDSANALRFFHGAIYGVWDSDALQNRINVRFELIQYLVSIGQTQQADSELIALASELPERSELHTRAGALFSAVRDQQRALVEFGNAVRGDPRDQEALLGAGRAALALGGYDVARGFFERAQVLRQTPAAADALKQIADIQSLDPFSRGIPYAERVNRALTVFQVAGTRLQACSPPQNNQSGGLASLLAEWQQLQPQVSQSALRRDPDLLDKAVDVALRAEQKATDLDCPSSSPEDSAIAAIAHVRGTK
jgi:tetratricopeptide (TPR) repeat protein